jgi:hypothetical protein
LPRTQAKIAFPYQAVLLQLRHSIAQVNRHLVITSIINETNEMLGLLNSIDRHGLDVIAMTIATNRDMVKRFAIPVMNLEGWPIARWTWIESQFVNIQMQAQ